MDLLDLMEHATIEEFVIRKKDACCASVRVVVNPNVYILGGPDKVSSAPNLVIESEKRCRPDCLVESITKRVEDALSDYLIEQEKQASALADRLRIMRSEFGFKDGDPQ